LNLNADMNFDNNIGCLANIRVLRTLARRDGFSFRASCESWWFRQNVLEARQRRKRAVLETLKNNLLLQLQIFENSDCFIRMFCYILMRCLPENQAI